LLAILLALSTNSTGFAEKRLACYPYDLFDLAVQIKINLEGEPPMASSCDICGKGPSFGNNVSHSQVKTRRRWNPNIQRVKTIVAGASKRQNVCTSCLKAGKVTR
jgi:large subunit ribosomal protein L28